MSHTLPSSSPPKGREAGSKGGINPTDLQDVSVWGNIINQYFHQDSFGDSYPRTPKQQAGPSTKSAPECSNQGEESHPQSSNQGEEFHSERKLGATGRVSS